MSNLLDSALTNPALAKPGSPDNTCINCMIFYFISRCTINGKYLNEI